MGSHFLARSRVILKLTFLLSTAFTTRIVAAQTPVGTKCIELSLEGNAEHRFRLEAEQA